MSKEASPKQEEQLQRLEQQVAGLYSRSLFLRDDEERTLQEAARALDKHAAFLFLFESEGNQTTQPLGRRIVKMLLESLRLKKSGRTSDAERLARMRDEAMAYRRSQTKKGFLGRCLTSIAFSANQKRSESLKSTELQVDVASAEVRQKAAFQLLALMFADRFLEKEKWQAKDQLQSVSSAIQKIAELRRRNFIYKKIYSEVRRRSFMDSRGTR
ncbi:hypothetical protein EBR21_10420 [bacterium]|nr:hypothetical protein [bacterium]